MSHRQSFFFFIQIPGFYFASTILGILMCLRICFQSFECFSNVLGFQMQCSHFPRVKDENTGYYTLVVVIPIPQVLIRTNLSHQFCENYSQRGKIVKTTIAVEISATKKKEKANVLHMRL